MSQSKNKKKYAKRRTRQLTWPIAIVAGGGLLLILVAFFSISQSLKPKAAIEVTGAPGLKVDKEKVDLGDVKLGQTVKVSFKITNIGDQPLRFTKDPYIEVKEGC